MFAVFCHGVLKTIAAAIVVIGYTADAQAGWFTLKNDTGETIIVQETLMVKGEVKRGKPMHLLPGEKLREFLPEPTAKRLEVFTPSSPTEAIWSGTLDCKDESPTYALTKQNGKVICVKAK